MKIIEAIKQGKNKKAEHMLLNNLAASPQNVEFLILLSVVLCIDLKGKKLSFMPIKQGICSQMTYCSCIHMAGFSNTWKTISLL